MKAKKEKTGLSVSIPAGVPINQPKWITEIETLCNEQGILPEDLVNEWKEMKSREKLYQQNKENDKHIFKKIREEIYKKNIDELNTVSGLSKWQLELRKKKLGI